MKFKKGDLVEVWDFGDWSVDKGVFVMAEYFAFNDHPEARSPHLVREYKLDGTIGSNICAYSYCRYVRLKMDDPVWVYKIGWWRRHFAGWADNGDMKYWKDGLTSHTVSGEKEYLTSREYRLNSPDSE